MYGNKDEGGLNTNMSILLKEDILNKPRKILLKI